MTALALCAAALSLAGWAWVTAVARADRRALVPLPPSPEGPLPSVTAVVPCRNEAPGLEQAMRSLLAQDLASLRVVAVDDRSSDGTGAILDRLAAAHPRLAVIHVDALPDGWLGKNHACAAGARRAAGEWLLFTDADVVFAPDALARALAAARRYGLGHLAVVPRLVAPGLLERAFVTAFAALLSPLVGIRDLPRPGTRAYFGVGAFNLVRRDAYERAGGHARLPLEVVDDVKLGLLLRRSGVPQGVAEAGALVSVRWQEGPWASALGLVKNAFAAIEYRPAHALVAAVGCAATGILPLVLLVLGPGVLVRALAAGALALSVLHHARAARRQAGGSGAEGLLLPACTLVLGAVILGSALAALARGGVVWRGTHYPLARVRAGCLREADLPVAGAVGWGSAAAPIASRPPAGFGGNVSAP